MNVEFGVNEVSDKFIRPPRDFVAVLKPDLRDYLSGLYGRLPQQQYFTISDIGRINFNLAYNGANFADHVRRMENALRRYDVISCVQIKGSKQFVMHDDSEILIIGGLLHEFGPHFVLDKDTGRNIATFKQNLGKDPLNDQILLPDSTRKSRVKFIDGKLSKKPWGVTAAEGVQPRPAQHTPPQFPDLTRERERSQGNEPSPTEPNARPEIPQGYIRPPETPYRFLQRLTPVEVDAAAKWTREAHAQMMASARARRDSLTTVSVRDIPPLVLRVMVSLSEVNEFYNNNKALKPLNDVLEDFNIQHLLQSAKITQALFDRYPNLVTLGEIFEQSKEKIKKQTQS